MGKTAKVKTPKFEAPISKWIRLYCSNCASWGKTCAKTIQGLEFIKTCMFAHARLEDQVAYLETEEDY